MDSNSSFLKNSSLTLVRHGFSMIVGLAVVTIIARVLGPEGQGQYAVIILLPTMLMTLLNMGVQSASVFHIGQRNYSIQTVYSTNLLIAVFLSLFSVALGLIVIHIIGDNVFSDVPNHYLLLILLVIPILYMNKLFQAIFQGCQDFKSFNIIIITTQVVNLLFVILIVYLLPLGLVGALISFFIGQIITLITIMQLLKKRLSIKLVDRSVSTSLIKQSFSYGVKAHLSNILAFINYRADIILISYFMNPVAVGVYVIAVTISEKMWVFSQAISTVLFPRISSYSEETQRNKLTSMVSKIVLYISAIVAIVVFFTVDSLVIIIFGIEYIESSTIIKILLPGIVLFSMDKILSNDLAGRGLPIINFRVSLITVMINITLNIALIPLYGLSGAAIATTTGYCITWIIKVITFSKITSTSLTSLFLITKDEFILYKGVLVSIGKKIRKSY